jgi:predicted PurR-regulated permease PerM
MYNESMASISSIQNAFFFILLLGSSYLVWKLFEPFWSVLALSAIIATICYPLYERLRRRVYRNNASLGASLAVLVVLLIIIFPLAIIGSLLLRETVSVYALFNSASYTTFTEALTRVESLIKTFVPEFSLDIGGLVSQVANFFASHLVSIFAGTASTIFYFLLTLIATFYFFRDGETIRKYALELSPLKDGEDRLILDRIAISVRSVALGTVLIALIQGILTSIGLWFFGFERAILWGVVASIGALVPGIGTAIVFIPAIAYLLFTGSFMLAGGLGIWALCAVGLIDNILGPYLMSRGGIQLHPFVLLLSVLGGIVLMGPVGFIVGPVFASLFTALMELFASHVKQ